LGIFFHPTHMEFGPWSLHGALDILAVSINVQSIAKMTYYIYAIRKQDVLAGNSVNTSAGFPISRYDDVTGSSSMLKLSKTIIE